jgi:hypothetical protein
MDGWRWVGDHPVECQRARIRPAGLRAVKEKAGGGGRVGLVWGAP